MTHIWLVDHEKYLVPGIVGDKWPAHLHTMKTIIAVLKGELPASPTTELICRVCVIITLVCFAALLILTFSNPI